MKKKDFLSKNINITGIYDPADNDLSIDMWEVILMESEF